MESRSAKEASFKADLRTDTVEAADGGFTQKERLLLEHIRQTFAELGPEALRMMQLIVTKSSAHDQDPTTPPSSDAQSTNSVQIGPKDANSVQTGGKDVDGMGAAKVGGAVAAVAAAAAAAAPGANVPSLRAIERFFLRLTPGEAAYWRVRPMEKDEGLAVPESVCAGDSRFRNGYHVSPVHVFASLKRMAAQWQKRYVDNFGRRTKAVDWPFPTTICQCNCFGWMFSDQILHRLRLLGPVHAAADATSAAAAAAAASAAAAAAAASGAPVSPTLTKGSKRAAQAALRGAKAKRRRTDPRRSGTISTNPVAPSPFACLAADDDDDETAEGADKSARGRPRELYLFDYPQYISRPPREGCAPPTNPLDTSHITTEAMMGGERAEHAEAWQPLPVMESLPEVVARHYQGMLDKVLTVVSVAAGPTDPKLAFERILFAPHDLPLLAPDPAPGLASPYALALPTNGLFGGVHATADQPAPVVGAPDMTTEESSGLPGFLLTPEMKHTGQTPASSAQIAIAKDMEGEGKPQVKGMPFLVSISADGDGSGGNSVCGSGSGTLMPLRKSGGPPRTDDWGGPSSALAMPGGAPARGRLVHRNSVALAAGAIDLSAAWLAIDAAAPGPYGAMRKTHHQREHYQMHGQERITKGSSPVGNQQSTSRSFAMRRAKYLQDEDEADIVDSSEVDHGGDPPQWNTSATPAWSTATDDEAETD
jgi:hypothetical protein